MHESCVFQFSFNTPDDSRRKSHFAARTPFALLYLYLSCLFFNKERQAFSSKFGGGDGEYLARMSEQVVPSYYFFVILYLQVIMVF